MPLLLELVERVDERRFLPPWVARYACLTFGSACPLASGLLAAAWRHRWATVPGWPPGMSLLPIVTHLWRRLRRSGPGRQRARRRRTSCSLATPRRRSALNSFQGATARTWRCDHGPAASGCRTGFLHDRIADAHAVAPRRSSRQAATALATRRVPHRARAPMLFRADPAPRCPGSAMLPGVPRRGRARQHGAAGPDS